MQILRETLERVITFARERFGQRPLALLGHSMGSAVVADYAQHDDDIPAVVGVSLVYDQTTPTSPRNLLVINGGLEKQLQGLAKKIIDQVSDGNGSVGVTYGDPQTGTGRRVTVAPGSEHIGVLFNPTTMAETLDWLNRCFNRPTQPTAYLDNRLPWMGLLYLSAGVLFWPFVELLRRRERETAHPAQNTAETPRYSKAQWAALMWGPAVLTPLLSRFLPTERLLPILIGGSLASHFAIYGLLTAIGMALTPQPGTPHEQTSLLRALAQQPRSTLLPALLMVGYAALMFGMPTDRFVLNMFPPRQRYGVVASVFAAMLPYFLADELLTRSPAAPRHAYPMTKASFILSLALAIALNPRKLFFLILIAPVFVAYFALYGTFSGLVYQRTGTPLAGALANTTIFAWTTAAIFPMIEQ
jgi:pimeloyl-ACP methyl ester carboxylesterase